MQHILASLAVNAPRARALCWAMAGVLPGASGVFKRAPRRYRARELRKLGQKETPAMRLVKRELEVSARVCVF